MRWMVQIGGSFALTHFCSPLQWRSSLHFDEMIEDDDDKASQLDNRFALNDIQVQGAIPFVRSLMTGVAMDLGFYLS